MNPERNSLGKVARRHDVKTYCDFVREGYRVTLKYEWLRFGPGNK